MIQSIRERALNRELLTGTFINLGSPLTAEMAGAAGFDWLLVDIEHGSGDQEALGPQLQAIGGTPAAPVVRIANNDPPRFKRVLDLGAGLGTTTLGAAVSAHDAGIERMDVTAVERDAISLRLLTALAEQCGHGELSDVACPITLTALQQDIRTVDAGGPYDLIVVGLALNELFTDADTVRRRAAWLVGLKAMLSAHGSIVVVEPALRETSRLLQQVRDEAHRFALTGHRARRGKARKQSSLDEIPGIGPKRRKALLTHFGGLKQLRNASASELARVPGINAQMAQTLYDWFHG